MGDTDLVLDPDHIVSDFECSRGREAVKLQFTRSRHVGCFVHFCQSLWRKVQELGFTVRCKNNIEFQLHIKSHMALAFLPDADVPGIFDELRKDCDDIVGLRQFHFSNPWVSGYFAISLWNQDDVPARLVLTTPWKLGILVSTALYASHIPMCTSSVAIVAECNAYQILLTLRASY